MTFEISTEVLKEALLIERERGKLKNLDIIEKCLDRCMKAGLSGNLSLDVVSASVWGAQSGLGKLQEVMDFVTSVIITYGSKAPLPLIVIATLIRHTKHGRYDPQELMNRIYKDLALAVARGLTFFELVDHCASVDYCALVEHRKLSIRQRIINFVWWCYLKLHAFDLYSIDKAIQKSNNKNP